MGEERAGNKSIVLQIISDMCFPRSARYPSCCVRQMVLGARAVYVGINTLVEKGVAKRYNASAIQSAGFNVRSEVPSHGYFHVMREVLMYLPERAIACAG
jgi:hypothetical protein